MKSEELHKCFDMVCDLGYWPGMGSFVEYFTNTTYAGQLIFINSGVGYQIQRSEFYSLFNRQHAQVIDIIHTCVNMGSSAIASVMISFSASMGIFHDCDCNL